MKDLRCKNKKCGILLFPSEVEPNGCSFCENGTLEYIEVGK